MHYDFFSIHANPDLLRWPWIIKQVLWMPALCGSRERVIKVYPNPFMTYFRHSLLPVIVITGLQHGHPHKATALCHLTCNEFLLQCSANHSTANSGRPQLSVATDTHPLRICKREKNASLSRPLGFKASFKKRREAGWGDPTDMRKCNLHIRGSIKG